MSKVAQDSDKIKTIGQLRRKMQEAGLSQFRVMVGVDFSLSCKWQGLHETGQNNVIVKTLRALEPQFEKYMCKGPIPAFRFGCKQTEERSCVPLNWPQKQDPLYETVDSLIDGYTEAVRTVEMYGPTQLSPLFRKAIQISSEGDHSHLMVCLIFTDGDIEDLETDCETLVEVSRFPVCFVAVGLGNNSFTALQKFDDLRSRKFDNFQLVEFNEVNRTMNGRVERPDLIMALCAFNELPAAYTKARKTGILK